MTTVPHPAAGLRGRRRDLYFFSHPGEWELWPFLPLETVATPSMKPIAVEEPKLACVPVELVTVAWAPEGLSATGPKVRLWDPV